MLVPGICNIKKKPNVRFAFMALSFLLFFAFSHAQDLTRVKAYIGHHQYQKAYGVIDSLGASSPEAMYLKGLCLYHLNRDLDQAVILLTKALASEGPDKTKLILGLIFHRQYRAEESTRMLRDFLNVTRDQEEKDLALRYIGYNNNISAVAHRGKIVEVKNWATIPENELALSFNEKNLADILVPKPNELVTRDDEKLDKINTLMFLPKDPGNIKYVYYSAYVAGRPAHSDIFRAMVTEDGEFVNPEPLGSIINTHFDEMYPYFDDGNQVLYFASKGHQSIGGFDIFMSYYNAGAESWSKPVNIGLPINSSMDDYLYCPENKEFSFLFATNRNATWGEVGIVNIGVKPGATFQTLVRPKEIEVFNNLKETLGEASPQTVGESKEILNDPEYKMLVKKALNAQVKADSLNRRVNEQQQRIDVALSESRKMALQSDLKIMQEENRVLQELANGYYDDVRAWEKAHGIYVEAPPKKPIHQVDEINGIKVYEYDLEETATKADTPKSPAPAPTVQKENKTGNTTTVKQAAETKNTQIISADDLPQDVIYTVQIGVFSKKVDDGTFDGLGQVFYYFIQDRELYKYFSGVYTDLFEARQHLNSVQGSGFPDSFLSAFHNREPVSISQAKELMQKQ
jgi:hypothetical protein